MSAISILCNDEEARLIAGILTGLILGSFTTMLSYRLPRGLSIVWPPSHCPACKARLSPLDLLPVLSWVLQRGRCRHCGAFIGWRYLLIEIAVTLAVIAAFSALGCTPWLLLALGAIVTLVTGFAIRAGRHPLG
ncbi:MAG TPA: prepilin peptidase [Methylocella sp.]|nr:prepilin peptidase [Methylocella sp.]